MDQLIRNEAPDELWRGCPEAKRSVDLGERMEKAQPGAGKGEGARHATGLMKSGRAWREFVIS
jgi:hypothetical protein